MTIFSSPASGTVQVAGRGRVKKNCPWNIAVVFFAEFLFFWPSDQCCIYEEIYSKCFCNIRVNVFKNFTDIGIIWMLRIFDCFTDCFSLRREATFGEFICPVHQFFHVFIRVFVDVIKSLFDSKFF